MWSDIIEVIQKRTRFVLTTHVNPDGDGVGAAAALTALLHSLGKQVRFVCDSPLPEKFQFLDENQVYEFYSPYSDFSQEEVLVVLDTHRKERIGGVANLVAFPNITSICIDHHELTDTFTEYHVIDSTACSVGAMVHSLIQALGEPLTLDAAKGIYASILCDTGRFSYSSTNREAHAIADDCLSVGVDPNAMYSRLFQRVPLREMRMFSKVLHRMETHLEDRVAVQVVRDTDLEGVGEDLESIDLEYLHEFTKMIEEVECVVLLRELPQQKVRVSCRSKNGVDIGRMMRQIGGGGHSKAAGATWLGTIEEAKRVVLDLLANSYVAK